MWTAQSAMSLFPPPSLARTRRGLGRSGQAVLSGVAPVHPTRRTATLGLSAIRHARRASRQTDIDTVHSVSNSCDNLVSTTLDASGSSADRERADQIPRFRLIALTRPCSLAPDVVSPSSRNFGLLRGDRRRGRGQTALLALRASVTSPALRPVIPRAARRQRIPLGGFVRCRLLL